MIHDNFGPTATSTGYQQLTEMENYKFVTGTTWYLVTTLYIHILNLVLIPSSFKGLTMTRGMVREMTVMDRILL